MIEITTGTVEERIIKLLQKAYPITIEEIAKQLTLSEQIITRVLKKFETKHIVQLEPLPDKTFVRLVRHDFSFVGKQRQRKFIKHHSHKKKQKPRDYDGMMYS